MKILRTTRLGANFTGSFFKKECIKEHILSNMLINILYGLLIK